MFIFVTGNKSHGYLAGINICIHISKTPELKLRQKIDEYGRTHQSGIHIPGRILINIWRIMRGEVKLNLYTFQNVVFQVLNIRYNINYPRN